jgi:hypothetical protein
VAQNETEKTNGTRKWQNSNAQYVHYTRRHNCISLYYINIWTAMWHRMEIRLKLMELKFVWYLNVSGTVDSAVVRVVIGLANWVLGRSGTLRYVKGIVCWQQIVLGGMDKGMGRGWLGRMYWNGEAFVEKFRRWIWMEDNSKSILIFNDLVSGINKHNINKGYGCGQCQAFWTWHWTGLLRNLYITWTINSSQAALYSMQFLNTQHRRNLDAVLTVGNLWRISGQCRHHPAGLSRPDIRQLVT